MLLPLLIHDLRKKIIILNGTLNARKRLIKKQQERNSTRNPPNTTVMQCPLSFSLSISGTKLFPKTPTAVWLNQRFGHSKLSMVLNFHLTSYYFRVISFYNNKNSNTKVDHQLTCVIGRNLIRLLATSSENLVANTQVLVVLATTESQFRALGVVCLLTWWCTPISQYKKYHKTLCMFTQNFA